MHKSVVTHVSLFLMMSILIILVPFTSSITFSNVKAQEYGAYVDDYDDNDTYSKHPTEENKYECRTGPFEGFFVSSVEFCKHIKFDDNKRDNRDKIEIIIEQELKVRPVPKAHKVQQVQSVLMEHKVYQVHKVHPAIQQV